MDKKEFEIEILSLVDKLYPMVFRYLGDQQNAEDALQEVMMKLWNKRTYLKEHPNKAAFVFLTAKNYCLDQLRKKNLTLHSLEEGVLDQVGSINTPSIEEGELIKIIEGLLKSLPEQQAEVLKLRDLDGLAFEEIAWITELKIEHIRVLLSRARKKVAQQLKDIYSYER